MTATAWFGLAALALCILTVAAVVSIMRHASQLSRRVLVVWLIVTVIFPPIGAIAWFAAGRRGLPANSV